MIMYILEIIFIFHRHQDLLLCRYVHYAFNQASYYSSVYKYVYSDVNGQDVQVDINNNARM